MQDEGSEVEVKLDGTPLKKGEETKLGVGMTISYGSTEYKASPCNLTTMRVGATWILGCNINVLWHARHGAILSCVCTNTMLLALLVQYHFSDPDALATCTCTCHLQLQQCIGRLTECRAIKRPRL